MASGRFVGTAELQHNPTTLLEDIITSGETCFITENGRAKAVIMDIHRYNCMMDIVEEAETLKHHGPGDETRKHISVKAILQRTTSSRLTRKRR
jgi:hypothetical protein